MVLQQIWKGPLCYKKFGHNWEDDDIKELKHIFFQGFEGSRNQKDKR